MKRSAGDDDDEEVVEEGGVAPPQHTGFFASPPQPPRPSHQQQQPSAPPFLVNASVISELNFKRNEDLQGACPTVSKPEEIGFFSLDENRRYLQDASRLRYYHGLEPSLNNLSHGYNTFVRRDDSVPEHLDHLLMCWRNLQLTHPRPGPSIMTWRGILTSILCAPYNRKEPLTLAVTLYQGTLYIEEPGRNPVRHVHSHTQMERHLLNTYWGYKFEQLVTNGSVQRPSMQQKQRDIVSPVNSNEAYCSVLRTKFGDHSIVLGAEVDCTDPAAATASSAYIELKTSKQIVTEQDQYSFERHKLLKFWAQSFLAGVPKVVVGFRDDNGFVRSLETFDTLFMPRLVRGKPGMWDPIVCLRFLDEFLSWLRRSVSTDDRRVSYIVQSSDNMDRFSLRMTTSYSFVPEWFSVVPPPQQPHHPVIVGINDKRRKTH